MWIHKNTRECVLKAYFMEAISAMVTVLSRRKS